MPFTCDIKKIFSIILENWKETILIIVGFFILFATYFLVPSLKTFPKETTIRIEDGTSVTAAGVMLEKAGYIKSESIFSFFVSLYGRKNGIIAGDYYFEKPLGIPDIARRMTRGEYALITKKVTIPEGLTVFQVADLFKDDFSLFDEQGFVAAAPEGYLFPDTYFFLPNADTDTVIEKMKTNFDIQIESLASEFASSTKSMEDVIIMASILEEEGKDAQGKGIISDILWRRIKIGMPLQVDAAFNYVNGKHTYTLTSEDLFDESPYNTYRNLGLPPTPISNPGRESILAALNPISNNFLYFLSDLEGNLYYAKDFEGHQRNREKYLRK